ncbi:MAG: hypothetical protein ACP5G8_09060 [Athalassotoga sp.]
MFKRVKEFFKSLQMIKVPEGSMVNKWGLPLVRNDGWDWYDIKQVKEVKK